MVEDGTGFGRATMSARGIDGGGDLTAVYTCCCESMAKKVGRGQSNKSIKVSVGQSRESLVGEHL